MLYQKHRPQTLSGIYGNRNLIVTLKNLLKDTSTIPHAFLFYGPTGNGKTTLARIIATELGCTKQNLIELDTAQFTGIDTVREIRKSAQYTPLGGGVRVYIIDEVHRMTNDAQNAFLKILEDTPPHIYFILCTTNEKSLLNTIRGRCSQYQVEILSEDQIEKLVLDVAEKEGKAIDEEVAQQIAKSSQGHARDALTILEQVLATPPKRRLVVAQQAQVLETESIELCRLLLKPASWNQISEVLKGLKGQEPESVRRVVLGYASAVLLNDKGGKNGSTAGLILECFIEPFYNTGFPGLVFACYQVIEG